MEGYITFFFCFINDLRNNNQEILNFKQRLLPVM